MTFRNSRVLANLLVLALSISVSGCINTVRFPAESVAYTGSIPSLLHSGDHLAPFENAQESKDDIVVVSKRTMMGMDTFVINPYEQIEAILRSLVASAKTQGAIIDSSIKKSTSIRMIDVIFEQQTLRFGGGTLTFYLQVKTGDWKKDYVASGQGIDNPLIPVPMRTGFQLEASRLAIQAFVNTLLTDKEFIDAARLR